jgi:hypothetical protein
MRPAMWALYYREKFSIHYSINFYLLLSFEEKKTWGEKKILKPEQYINPKDGML